MDCQNYCSNRIYRSILEDICKEEEMYQAQYQSIQKELRKKFAELMDADSLNVNSQREILAMKNKLHLKLVNLDDSSTNIQGHQFPSAAQPKTYDQQLHEAFADLFPVKQEKTIVKTSSETQKKKSNQRPALNVDQTLNGLHAIQLRNQIFEKIERDAISSNRLQHQESPESLGDITLSRKDIVGAHINRQLTQLHAPGTANHQKCLVNSYISSEVDFVHVGELIDLEMAVNLGQMTSELSPSPLFTNLNCHYDFRPTNFNFLMLSRLSFAPKKKRIHKLIRKKILEKRENLKVVHDQLEERELTAERVRQNVVQRNFKEIELGYPKFFKEKIAPHLKRQQQFESENQHQARPGPSQYLYTPGRLFPSSYKASNSLGAFANEIPDDFLRARSNHAAVPQPNINIYTKQPTVIAFVPHFKLIADPIAYEMEYKRKNVWSLQDIRTFVITVLRYTKNIDKIGEALPHKSASEIVFFYHTFKKLINLKMQIKNCREVQKLKAQPVSDASIQSQTDEILLPLTEYAKRQKFEIVSDEFLTPSTPQNIRLQHDGQMRGNHQMQRNMFNAEELIQIFAQNSQNIRRRPKPQNSIVNESLISQNSSRSLYPFNTFAIRPEFLGCPSITVNPYDITEHQQAVDDNEQMEFGFKNGLILGKRLHKIDYIEYLERSGKDMLKFFLANSDRVNYLSDQLRMALTQRDAIYGSMESDNFRIVNFMMTPQAKNALQNWKKRDQKQIRNFQDHFLFNYVLPKQESKSVNTGNKRRSSKDSGFTQAYFAKISEPKNQQENEEQVIQSQPKPNNKRTTKILKTAVTKPGTFQQKPIEAPKTASFDEAIEIRYADSSINSDRGANEDSQSSSQLQQESKQVENSSDVNKQPDNSNSNTKFNAFGNNPWQANEKEQFVVLLRIHGKNFQKISIELGSRSTEQCRNYFQNYKVKLNLNQYIDE